MIETINGKAYLKVGDKVYELGGGSNIITADSVEQLPDPASVPEGTIAMVKSEGGGGGSLDEANAYTDEKIAKIWTDVEVFDFTAVFDFVESVMQGGALVEKPLEFEGHGLGEYVVSQMQNGPVKIKVAFNGTTANLIVFAQDFGNYCQFTDFVVMNGHMLYLYIMVTVTNTVRFQCQEVTTAPYNPS